MDVRTFNVVGNKNVLDIRVNGFRVETITAFVDSRDNLTWVNTRDERFDSVGAAEFSVYAQVMCP